MTLIRADGCDDGWHIGCIILIKQCSINNTGEFYFMHVNIKSQHGFKCFLPQFTFHWAALFLVECSAIFITCTLSTNLISQAHKTKWPASKRSLLIIWVNNVNRSLSSPLPSLTAMFRPFYSTLQTSDNSNKLPNPFKYVFISSNILTASRAVLLDAKIWQLFCSIIFAMVSSIILSWPC